MELFIMKLVQRIVGREIQGNGDDLSGAIAILGIVGLTMYHVVEITCRKTNGDGKDK